jgi:hypothetical protein
MELRPRLAFGLSNRTEFGIAAPVRRYQEGSAYQQYRFASLEPPGRTQTALAGLWFSVRHRIPRKSATDSALIGATFVSRVGGFRPFHEQFLLRGVWSEGTSIGTILLNAEFNFGEGTNGSSPFGAAQPAAISLSKFPAGLLGIGLARPLDVSTSGRVNLYLMDRRIDSRGAEWSLQAGVRRRVSARSSVDLALNRIIARGYGSFGFNDYVDFGPGPWTLTGGGSFDLRKP